MISVCWLRAKKCVTHRTLSVCSALACSVNNPLRVKDTVPAYCFRIRFRTLSHPSVKPLTTTTTTTFPIWPNTHRSTESLPAEVMPFRCHSRVMMIMIHGFNSTAAVHPQSQSHGLLGRGRVFRKELNYGLRWSNFQSSSSSSPATVNWQSVRLFKLILN